MSERIVAAALRTPGNLVVTLPAPARHHDVIAAMGAAGMSFEAIANSDQGFVTAGARYLPRREAFVVAKAAGQLNGCSVEGILFSEDLW